MFADIDIDIGNLQGASMIFDVAILGAGVAGSYAAYEMATKHKNKQVICIDFGRPPMKRRQQMSGWLGLLPNSDGKFFLNDIDAVAGLTTAVKSKSAAKQVKSIIKNITECPTIKDKGPTNQLVKKISKAGYSLQLNDYFQLYPKDIHSLSKHMAEVIEEAGNVTFSFDNEVQSIHKNKNIFIIQTELQEVRCKKVILCFGRGGWREARDIFQKFGLVDKNDVARFGVRIEMPAHTLKDFNKSNCRIMKPSTEIGPLSWFGTVVPEDQTDVAISSFRSNENRWKTDKVSFQFIGNIPYPNEGFEQTDRIAKLTFLLSNDRIVKEKVSSIINKKNKILSIIPEYNWLPERIREFSTIIPEILTKAYFHIPTIIPMAPSIKITNTLSTEVDGFYVAGESAGVQGLYAAAITGIIAADAACKK